MFAGIPLYNLVFLQHGHRCLGMSRTKRCGEGPVAKPEFVVMYGVGAGLEERVDRRELTPSPEWLNLSCLICKVSVPSGRELPGRELPGRELPVWQSAPARDLAFP
jgi:hypothetical protein